MKKEFKKINTTFLLAILLVTATFLSCSKWDGYKQYTENGEIIYSGKMDSVKAYGGYKRVRIAGQMNADPKITTIKIFWNSNKDSVVFDARTTIVNGVFNQAFPVAEGLVNFIIYTYDAAGNKSVPVYTSATIYGDNYQNSLLNRLITGALMQASGSGKIDWAEVNANAGVIGTEVKYVDMSNTNHDTTIYSSVSTAFSSSLPNYKAGTNFQYRTLYKPTATAIDTFYSSYQDFFMGYDVSSLYLANYKTPFTALPSPDWRYATLAAPWVTNAAAKNKGGGAYGGWSAEPWQGTTGFIGWETWGKTPITDGIVYQPTSSALPAGKYTVEFNYYSEIQSNSSIYCVVAAGGSGIPTLANLSSAIGYTALYNGVNVGATSPSKDETKTFSFTLSSSQMVSIGFLGNLRGDGDPGNYYLVRYIKLIRNS